MTVDVGPNATGYVTVTVNGQEKTIPVDEDGKVTYVIPNVQPGDLNITAAFLGDKNYEPVVKSKNTTVPKYPTSMEILDPVITKDNNVTVVVKVNATDATGKVTVTIDGENYTADVVDGIAKVNIGIVEPNTTPVMNITYTGDKKYNATELKSVDTVEVGKLNNFTAEIEIIEGQYGENTTVKVTVPSDATGNITVTVDGKEYPVVKDDDGNYIAQIPSTVGNHTVKVSYTNDTRYNDTELIKQYSGGLNDNYNVKINVTEGDFGEDTIIEVGIPKGINNVTVTIDGKDYFVPVDNTTGKGKFVINNLTAGDHTVTVNVPSNGNYSSKTNTTVISIPQATSEMNMEFIGGEPGENLTVVVDVGPNATGHVVVTVNGQEHTVPVDKDGKATYVIPDAQPGDYNITAAFLGDSNYEPVKKNITKTVPKYESSIEVSEPIITKDNNVTVVVKVNETDATGKVTVTVDGKNYTADVVDGIAKVNIGIVEPNTTPVMNITYTGDKKYAGSELKSVDTVEVGKLDNFTAEIEIIEGQYGENTTVKVTVPADATGNITVTVDDKEYPVIKDDDGNYIAQIPSDVVGNHTVKVSYTNDTRYNDTEIVKTYEVEKNDHYDVNVTIVPVPTQFGTNTTIEVEIPEGMDNVTVIIDGKEITVPVNSTTGKGQLVINNLTAGDHTISVVTPGNENYDPVTETTTLTVGQATSDMAIDFVGGEPGENLTVIVNVGPNATGHVVVTVNGEEHIVPVDEIGNAVYVIPNAQPGDYNITAEFLGDGNYEPVKNKTVPKYPASMEILDPVITDDNNVTVVVKVDPANATGTVTVTVDGKNYTAEVKDGVAEVNIGIVEPNTTPVMNITYSGDKNYDAVEMKSVDSVEVGKLNNFTADIKIIPGQQGENTTVLVDIPSDATGKVNVTIDGKEYPLKQYDNGTYYLVVDDLSVGNHTVNVTYSGDERYAGKNSSEKFGVDINSNYPLDVKVTPAPYGNDTVIDVTGPAGTNVTVNIDGVNHTVTVDESGKGQRVLNNLTAGKHDITVKYDGDENHTAKTDSTSFTIDKVEPGVQEFNVTSPVDVGQPVNVTVKLPADATGTITVNVNGTKYTADVVNGVANISIPKLDDGTYDINITYSGDDNYDPITVTKPVSVEKVNPPITASVGDATLGGNVQVNVTVPDDATGTVTIKIGDIEKTVAVTGGLNNIIIPDVPVGDYEVEVTYNGDNKYAANTTKDSLKVSPKNTTADDVRIIDNGDGTITVVVPEGATGNVTVTIGNETLPVEKLTNGRAVINLTQSAARPGSNNITVTYSGDENHTAVSVKSSAVIPKWDSSVNATAKTIREGDDAIITVTVDPDMTGRVRVDINGTGYYADINNGVATITAPGIKAGTYIGNVTYDGDDSYNPSNNTFTLTVEAPINVNIDGAGESSQLVIDLPENGTDDVTVTVDGVEYPVTIVNGTAIADLSNVTPGEHNVSVVYTDKYGTQSVVNTTIKVYRSINADNMTRGWNSPFDYEAEFLDKDGHVLANTTVEFKVNGKTYNVKTDDKGIAKLTESKLPLGTYEVEVTNPATKEVVKRNVTIVKRLVENKDVTLDFMDGTSYVVRAIGDDGKPVGQGEVVGFTVNNRGYVAKTDANGYARLKINLNPKTYTIVAEYSKYKVSNKVVVKQVLKLVKKTVTVKKTAKKLVIKAKLKKSNGKAIVGKKLKLKFKGKTYTAKTNKKGIAKFTVKKNVIKKLKKGKKYSYTVSYSTNKVKGKVKVKK